MELVTGIRLIWQQYKSLFRKNVILTRRNRRSATAQILSPVLFMFLLFVISRDPVAIVPSIPACEEKLLIRPQCYDFAWTGNDSATFASIADAIMKNNHERPIPPSKVKSFRTKKEVDEWLLNDPMRCPGSTQLQVAAEREIARFLIGELNFSRAVVVKAFAHPPFDGTVEGSLKLIASAFFLTVSLFGFVFQLSSLIAEKELKLRQAMTLMGLYDTAYWTSWLTWEVVLAFISSAVIVVSGTVCHIPFFLRNSIPAVFLVFFLFQINMIGFAFTLSTIVKKSSSATTVGFFIFILSFFTQMATKEILGLLGMVSKHYPIVKYIWSLFPPNLLSHALDTLKTAATDPTSSSGISWWQTSECPEMTCLMSLRDVYKWLLLSFVMWFMLAIYLDNIILNSSGVRRPSIWTNGGGLLGSGYQRKPLHQLEH